MLKGREKRALRAQANTLKAELRIGKEAVTPGVIHNLENSFRTKELVKIKVLRSCPLDKKQVAEQLCQETHAELVQILGNTIVLYRPLPEDE